MKDSRMPIQLWTNTKHMYNHMIRFNCQLLLFVSFISLAQNEQPMLVIDYDFYLNFDGPTHFRSSLYIKGNERLFVQGHGDNESIEEEKEQKEDGSFSFSFKFFENDSIGGYNYTNLTNDTIISRKPWFDKKIYFLKEQVTQIDWRIYEDTQKVGSILCQKASGNFRGRTYEVWFAPEFPLNAGPWKLSGLPGIILKAADTTGKSVMVFSKIRKEDPALFPRIGIDNEKFISIEEYAKLQKSAGQELARKLMAKMPRGVKIEATSSESLEIFED